jgi:predicted ribosome quality control (RQC) complex YloA/Tae2 family protein
MLLVPQKIRRGVPAASPLLLLLRKWVRDSTLVDVAQPPWERILSLHFHGDAGRCQLVAELIGRYSNIILVGPGGRVLEAVKHVGPELNRYRVTLPAQPYQPPPPPPGRIPPVHVATDVWAGILSSVDPSWPLHRVLATRFYGISPTVGREVAARLVRDPGGPVGSAPAAELAHVLEDLFAPLSDGSWRPHIATDAQGQTIAFAPYELTQFEHCQPVSSISRAMWAYFQQRSGVDAYAAARRAVRQLIAQATSRVQHALHQVSTQVIEESEIDALREQGELLLTYQHRIDAGASRALLPGYDGRPRSIDLDPSLSPVENAQAAFKRYRKAIRAASRVPARIRALKADLAYLRQLDTDLTLAESRPEIDAVHEGLAKAGWTASKPKNSSSGMVQRPRRFDIAGFPVFVGRNAVQNEEVTFGRGKADDMWLHVRGLPGAHVLVKRGGRTVPEDVIRQAASLAAYYSSARGNPQVDVDATERRFVKRPPGARPGQVTYRNERTLRVAPRGLAASR